jgi:hypothetical protein
MGQIQKCHNKGPDPGFDASLSFSKTIMFYSECPGEVHDEYEDYLGEEFTTPIEQETKGNFVVLHQHKHDLTIFRSEFDTMQDALEFALWCVEKDYIVNSVITRNYTVTV